MEPQIARLDRAGRLVLPAPVRAELELREGDEVVFVRSVEAADEVTLVPRKAALRRAQAIVRQYIPAGESLADELIAERREEAAREEAGWQQYEQFRRS
jgi:AbrB family looped-hinge helix DNA binding protein